MKEGGKRKKSTLAVLFYVKNGADYKILACDLSSIKVHAVLVSSRFRKNLKPLPKLILPTVKTDSVSLLIFTV